MTPDEAETAFLKLASQQIVYGMDVHVGQIQVRERKKGKRKRERERE